MEENIEKIVQIGNVRGLHARPAAELGKIASGFNARITLEKPGQPAGAADCRSIMGLLMLAAPKNSELLLKAEGPDAVRAVEQIIRYFASNFDEE